MLIETHTHLSDAKFQEDRDETIQRAFEAGLETLIEIADSDEEWGHAQALAEKYPGKIYWTAGLHPYYVDRWSPDVSARFPEALKHPQCVGLGEIGLDYCKSSMDRDLQKKVFHELIQVALAADKPMVLHCREKNLEALEAQTDMLDILRGYISEGSTQIRGVAHCFQGQIESVQEFIRLGFMIGIDGPVTYPKSDPLRDLVRDTPLSSLVLETDSPYLPPQAYRGKRNEPSYLVYIAEKIAEVKGISVEEVHKATTENAKRLYRLV